MAELKEALMIVGALVLVVWFGFVVYLIGSAIYDAIPKRKGWKERMEEDILSTMSMCRHIEKILEKKEEEKNDTERIFHEGVDRTEKYRQGTE